MQLLRKEVNQMSDGRIVIDVELDDSQVRTDARVIEELLHGLGNNAGQNMQNSFNHNTQQMQHDASQAAGRINSEFNRPIDMHLNLNATNAQHEANQVFNNINHQAQTTEEHLHSLKSVFEGTFLANAAEQGIEYVKEGITSLIEKGVEYNAEQDKMKAVWGVLTGSASKGNAMVDMVNNFQKATGYATDTLNEMEQKIYHIKGSASETQEMTKVFTTLGDAMGLSDEKLLSVSEQFSQMMATGKAYSGDLNIMTNAFPAFGDALQEHMKMGMGQIRQMASQGKLSAKDVEDTLIDMQKKYAGATEAVMGTTQGLWRSMQSNFGRLAGAFAKPLFDMKKSGFKDLSDWLSSNDASKMFESWGQKLADAVGYLVDFINFLAKHRDTVLAFSKAILEVVGGFLAFKAVMGIANGIETLIGVVGKLVKAFGSAEAALELMGGPIGWIVLGITAIGIGFVEAYNKSKPFHDFVNNIGKGIKGAWSAVTQFGQAVKEMFEGKWVQGGDILLKLGFSPKQIQATKAAVHEVQDAIKGLGSVFSSIGTGIQKAYNFISTFVSGVTKMFKGQWVQGGSLLLKLGLDGKQIETVRNAVHQVQTWFGQMKDFLGQVFNTISKSVKSGIDYASGYIQGAVNTLKKYWDSIWPELGPAVTNLFKILKTIIEVDMFPVILGFKALLAAFMASWKNIWASICDIIKIAFDLIVGAVKVGWDIVSGIFKVIVDILSGNFSKAWKDMKSTVINTVTDLWDGLKKLCGDIGNLFVDLGKTIANGLLAGLAVGVNAVSDGINWILDKVHAPSGARLGHWTPPHYAQGTDGHQGGLAVVGDGKKRELIRTPNGEMFLSPNTDTLVNLPQGTNVLDGDNTEKLMHLGMIPRYANGIGGVWDWMKSKASGAWSDLKSVGNNIWNYVTNPQKLIQAAVSNFTHLGGMLDPALGLAEGAISTAADDSLDWIKQMIGFGSVPPSGSVPGSVAQWLATAMGITNTPLMYLGALEQIAMHESGGNPHAINLWDSNAKAGHPSKGLMQTIDSTFNRYEVPGLGDIWNPVANVVAAIRYMNASYGSIANVPGVRSLSKGGHYVGYANGTGGSVGGNVVVAENEPELIQTTDGRIVLATQPTSFSDFMSGSIVTPLSKIPSLAHGVIAKAKSVLNSVGNPTLNTPLVKASLANSSKENTVDVNIQPIVVQAVLDGRVISETVTNVQNQNTVRTSRLRGEI